MVYQTLDQFEEKQKLKGASNVPSASGQQGRPPTVIAEPTYQGILFLSEIQYIGLMNEAFISAYQLDVYGFITNTNYKYVIVKNETKTSNLG